MTLPTSGTLQASDINVELGRAWNHFFDMNGTAERNLAGKPSGAISFSDFYGKSNLIREPASGDAFNLGNPSTWWSSGWVGDIAWMGSGVFNGNVPDSQTSIVKGTWTYYRGSYRGQYFDPGNKEYGLYRIGRY